MAQPAREIRGQVFHLGESGEKISEPGLIATLVETGATDDANDQGIFRLPLPPAFQPGDSVTISIDKPGWRIRFPLDGEAKIPRNLQREIIPVELLQVGSKLFWTNDRIEKFIRDASERSKQEGRREGNNPSLDLGRDIKDWAAKYGFSAEKAREEIDRWIAEVEAAHEDSYQKGLAAFAKQQFDTAAERFRESAEWRIRQFDEIRKQQEKLANKAERLQEEVVRDLRLQGDSHYYAYRYEQALAVYEQAHQYTSKDRTPRLWGATLNDIGRTHRQLGVRVGAAESPAHLTAAVQTYRQALLVYTREQMPEGWAETQDKLGNVLLHQAIRTVEEAPQLLAEAVQAHRQALLIRTREQLPQDWAATQSNLGRALVEQGTRTAGEEGTQLLAQAVQAHQQALLVYTREQLPQQWAANQACLGNALLKQGERTAGEDGDQLIALAVQAHQEALLVYTREQLPQQWATNQHLLGNALFEQGRRMAGNEGAQLTAQAVRAFQQALLVYTHDQLPLHWAALQNNLGAVFHQEGSRMVGDEGTQLLAQAVETYQQALLVYTRERLPVQWAAIHENLGKVLRRQGARTAGEEGAQLFAEAVRAYRQALLVYTREQLPQRWAWAQAGLGEALYWQGIRASGEGKAQLAAQAVDAFRQALLVLKLDHYSQGWGFVRTSEAEVLLALHRYGDAAEALSQILAKELDASRRIVVLGYAIAVGLAMDSPEVPDRVKELLGLVAAQPQDFSVISWTFEATLHWLDEDPEVSHKDLLTRLFQALKAPDRDSMLQGLRDVEAILPGKPSQRPGKDSSAASVTSTSSGV